MKKNFRLGFTLVELLVVISIIGMLAGLLLPAVNAAREMGRRAVCINNQSQLALALLTYEASGGRPFPAMRDLAFTGTTSATVFNAENIGSWIAYILPQMEYGTAWEKISTGKITEAESKLAISSLRCPSCDTAPGEDGFTSYVCNGGYQNAVPKAADWKTLEESGNEPSKKQDAVFFDNRAYKVTASTATVYCTEKQTTDYIFSHDGTSNTIFLSENLNAGKWMQWDSTNVRVFAGGSNGGEPELAFCFPYNTNMKTKQLVEDTTGPLAEYGTGSLTSAWSCAGYDLTSCGASVADITVPLFINGGRTENIVSSNAWRKARPSSNHPNMVVAAFVDRSVRTLTQTINKQVFVQLCQPASNRVINPKDIN